MSTGIDIKKKLAILNEGANVTTDATSIDFVGSGVNSSTVGNNVTVTIPGGSGNTTYYFNYSVSLGSVSEFSSIPTSAAEQVIPWTVDPGVTEVAFQFETQVGVPNTTQIPAGLWQFFLHFNALGPNESWIIRPTVYKIDISNVETLLFTADPEVVTNMPIFTTMYTCDGVFPATTLLTTDRLLVKISLENIGFNTQTLNFVTEGSQHYSVAFTTLNQVISGGSVTSVTGTAPIVSSGGTTPAISIPQATGSVDGYLSSSDWSVFSAKLGGSGTTNYLSKFTGTSTLGNSIIQDNGSTASINGSLLSAYKFIVYSNTLGENYCLAGNTTVNGSVGVVGFSNGTGASTNYGVSGSAQNSTTKNIAVYGQAQGASAENIGGQFRAITGTNNYAVQLQDGTESLNKFLKSVSADGKANWANITVADTGLTLTTTGTSGAATLVGSTLNIPNYATSSSGIVGIRNSSGIYTYYATLSLAIAAATSGQTVDLLTDITETGSVTITTKEGVKINGNGYTYTLNVNDGTHAITQVGNPTELFNLKVVRTGRANNSTGVVFFTNTSVNAILKCQNVVFENTYGVGVLLYKGTIYNLTVNSFGTCISTGYDYGYIYDCKLTSSNSIGYDNSFNAGEISNCVITASSGAIILASGSVYNSIGRTASGSGINAPRVYDSTGTSSSGAGITATNGYNCVGISTSGIGLSGTFTNSTGISTSGYAGTNGTKTNCTLISSSNNSSNLENLNNCFLQSSTNVPLWSGSSKLINGCTVLCLWDNVAGHTIHTASTSTGIEIRNCNLTVTNASAYCLNSQLGSTIKYASNTYKGATVAVNTTNITQGITNTSDNQGNILI